MHAASPEYAQLKKERSEVLWKAVEKVIPDIRTRAEVRFGLRHHSGWAHLQRWTAKTIPKC